MHKKWIRPTQMHNNSSDRDTHEKWVKSQAKFSGCVCLPFCDSSGKDAIAGVCLYLKLLLMQFSFPSELSAVDRKTDLQLHMRANFNGKDINWYARQDSGPVYVLYSLLTMYTVCIVYCGFETKGKSRWNRHVKFKIRIILGGSLCAQLGFSLLMFSSMHFECYVLDRYYRVAM